MKRFFSYDGDSYDLHETAEEARRRCDGALCDYREYASSDGWADEVESIFWGPITEHVVETERKSREDFEDPEEARSELRGFDYWCDYALQPVEPASSNVVTHPATRADAVQGVATVRQLLGHILVLDTVERDRLEQQLAQALVLLGGGA